MLSLHYIDGVSDDIYTLDRIVKKRTTWFESCLVTRVFVFRRRLESLVWSWVAPRREEKLQAERTVPATWGRQSWTPEGTPRAERTRPLVGALSVNERITPDGAENLFSVLV